jgi:hypothetical protein
MEAVDGGLTFSEQLRPRKNRQPKENITAIITLPLFLYLGGWIRQSIQAHAD